MIASEFITKLQDLIDEHGDLEVIVADESEATVEFNDDEAELPVFIIT